MKTKVICILLLLAMGISAVPIILNRNEATVPTLHEIDYLPEQAVELITSYEHYESVPTPPSAIPINITVPAGQKISPTDMLENIAYTIQYVYFVEEPCIFTCGEQTLLIELTDAMRHNTIIPVVLTILPNEKPPIIEGVSDLIIRRFGTLLLRQDVTAHDVFGNPLEFGVLHAIDVETPGIYSIIYYTYDRWGNRAEAFAYVTITDVDIDWVYASVDQILGGITNPGDSQVEQARAIHTWMRRNMTYTATVGRIGRYENAYQGLRHRRGNCFVYFYTAEIMLTRLGIPNRRIDRVGGATNHRWHLINPDDMGWHHMDTGPQSLAIAGRFCTFMFTSSQAAEFTDIIYREVGRHSHYNYDRELHPYIVD